MDVATLIPFASVDTWRKRALAHVRGCYPWPVVTGWCPDPWRKAVAVKDALHRTTAEILVVADADCVCPAGEAVQAVIDGAAWAMPHDFVVRLTPEGTDAFYRGDPPGRPAERHPGMVGGGIVVVSRATYEQVPLDSRFTGWGHEDFSWAVALECVAGPGWRGTETLTHLWHPPQPRDTRRIGSHASRMLERRYWRARADVEAMRSLLDEAREALPDGPIPAHDDRRHDHTAVRHIA